MDGGLVQIAADVNDLTGCTRRLSVRLKEPPLQGIRKGGTIQSCGGNDPGQKIGKVPCVSILFQRYCWAPRGSFQAWGAVKRCCCSMRRFARRSSLVTKY